MWYDFLLRYHMMSTLETRFVCPSCGGAQEKSNMEFCKDHQFLSIVFPEADQFRITFVMDVQKGNVKGISVYGQKQDGHVFHLKPALVKEVFQPQLSLHPSMANSYVLRMQPMPDWAITIRHKKNGTFSSNLLFPTTRKRGKIVDVVVAVSDVSSELPSMTFTVHGMYRASASSVPEDLSETVKVPPTFVATLKTHFMPKEK